MTQTSTAVPPPPRAPDVLGRGRDGLHDPILGPDLVDSDEVAVGDLFRPLIRRWRVIWQSTLLIVLLAALIGGGYYLFQPVTRMTTLEFRPMFEGARDKKYPNGLSFAPTDIVSPLVVDRVYQNNNLQSYCPADAFRSGVTVQETSVGLEFLNLEYQSRLSDQRLTPIDRQRLQDEYSARRASMANQYQLRFIEPRACSSLPEPLVAKALPEVLETWALAAQEKRGVLKVRAQVLSPGIFDQPSVGREAILVRADLLRTAVARVIANISDVERLPGSELVRGSDKNISFSEVRAELEDLLQARLDPVVALAARGLGPEAARWIEQAVQAATIRLRAAEQRAEVYKQALREYSGAQVAAMPSAVPLDRQTGPSDVQSISPQIDRTFIDRIVEMSGPNTSFRQEITRQVIDASVEAVERGAIVEQYKQLLAAVRSGGEKAASDSVEKALDQVTGEAKEATRRFNEIYQEFSRLTLSTDGEMYRIDQPVQTSAIRAFTLRRYALIVLIVLATTLLLLSVGVVAQHQLRRIVPSLR